MVPLIDEAETQRQAQIREQFVRSYRARTRSRLRGKIFAKVRWTFIFLLGAAVVTFIVVHRNNINSAATSKTRQQVAQAGDAQCRFAVERHYDVVTVRVLQKHVLKSAPT